MVKYTVLPQSTCPTTHPLDRRAAERYHCEREFSFTPVPGADEEEWSARVQDISATGIGLLVDHCIEPETLLAVRLQAVDPSLSYTILVQVMNTRSQSESKWLLGCAFTRELSADELQALL